MNPGVVAQFLIGQGMDRDIASAMAVLADSLVHTDRDLIPDPRGVMELKYYSLTGELCGFTIFPPLQRYQQCCRCPTMVAVIPTWNPADPVICSACLGEFV